MQNFQVDNLSFPEYVFNAQKDDRRQNSYLYLIDKTVCISLSLCVSIPYLSELQYTIRTIFLFTLYDYGCESTTHSRPQCEGAVPIWNTQF